MGNNGDKRGQERRDLVGTIEEVAAALRCGDDLIRDLIAAGRIPHVKLGTKLKVIPWRALEEWLAAEAAASTLPIPAADAPHGSMS